MEGPGNAAVDPVRSTTCSGLSFATPNVSDSRQVARKTMRMMGEWKMNADTGRTVHGSTPQFLGTTSGSYTNPRMAKRPSSVTPLMYTNSSRRKPQSPKSAPRQVQTKQQRELEHVRQKRTDLANRQHRYAVGRIEVGKRRALELQKVEKDREDDEEVILEMEKEVAERHQANASNQDNLEEIEAELRQIEEKIDASREEFWGE